MSYPKDVRTEWIPRDGEGRILIDLSGTAEVDLDVTADFQSSQGIMRGQDGAILARATALPDSVVSRDDLTLNARSEGAAGDGATDDTAALRGALARLADDGGGTLLIPSGDYVTGPLALAPRVRIMGDGPGTVLRHAGGNGTMISTADESADRLVIENLTLQLDAQTAGNGIDLVNDSGPYEPEGYRDSHHVIRNVLINEPFGHGVYISGQSRENHLSSVLVRWKNVGGARGGHGFFIDGTDNYFVSCTAATTQDGAHGWAVDGADNRFLGCKAFWCGTQSAGSSDGFRVNGPRNQLIGCQGQDNGRRGFSFTTGAEDSTAVGLVADANGGTGFSLAGGLTGLTLSGFAAYNRPGGRYAQPIGIALSGTAQGCVIRGRATGTTPISLATPTFGANIVEIATTSGRVFGSGGLASSGRRFRPGKYYAPEGTQADTTAALAQDRLFFIPWPVGRTLSVDRIGLEVTTHAASAVIRIGVYADSNGGPGARLVDAGTIDASASAFAAATVDLLLTPGLYWVGVALQAASGVSVRARAGSSPYVAQSTTDTQNAATYFEDGVSGALPATAAASPATSSTNPKPLLRAV